ncbi:DENN domain-containing protein 2B-like isoform X1 [Huso huso]|uniref:DENN domain-containing protein 2B-like isoform X1 n=1 Tax=Huso huso TaxID=61971 RepID=A0ABR0YKA9_HUSHU
MTANKNAKVSHRAGGNKAPRDIPDRCQSASPPPISSPVKGPAHPLSDSDEPCWKGRYAKASDSKLLSLKNWSNRASTLRSGSTLPSDIDSQNRLLKSVSIGCLDTKLSLYKPLGGGKDQKENHQEGPASDGVSSNQLGWSTLCLGPASNHRSLSLSRSSVCSQSLGIRKKISEWECRKATPARMSLCLDKRPLGDRVGNEVCPSLLPSPCSEKTFDFKGVRRMSRTFSECSYPETEEEEALDKEPLPRFEKRLSKIEPASAFLRTNSRKETSAVLNRIQKIEQALKDSPSRGPPQFLSNCYGADKVRNNSFTIGSPDDAGSVCNSKRGSFSSVVTEPDSTPGTDKVSKMKQRFSVSSESSYCPELLPENPDNTSVNPVPKPKRTFEYEADRNHKSTPSNGLPPTPTSASPPPLPSTPAPPVTRRQKKKSIFHRKVQNRKSLEFEDASSLQSSHTPSPTENGSASPETRSRFSSKSTLEENAYEDIVESPKENPYEDVDLKGRSLGRKTKLSSENSLHRMWTLQDRKYTTPPQLPSKPSSQSLRLPGPSERKSHRLPRLSKRHSHDDMLLLPQLSVPPPSCRLNEDSLSTTSELSTRRPRRVPKLVQRINNIYSAKRGKKRLKKLSMSNIETSSLRDENSESESDSDDRFKAHTQRLLHLQSMLRRAPSYRTLELELIQWQERELFEYFVVVSLKKKPSKNSYIPDVTYQFPKLERPTKQMREAEGRLKAIPQFCFPDVKDWTPVLEYSSETFSFMLTGEDGSRRFGYCRRLLPSGKGPRLPEVYCVISRLGCFDLFSKILDEVERRREVSAALVYPFMRSLMESPFPAPGKTIKVKTFLPGAGNEVIELRRPMDSRLEHVDFDSLFRCLSVRQVIRVFASLLLERRVIFVADKLSILSSCVHAVVALLYPFSWQHTFIPVLPSSIVDIVCCPTPFLVGLLSSSLPKLKELPVEEALMVDLGTDRFIRQMDDEDTLLPRKLQAALEQALEQKNDLMNQDSDSESDEECDSLSSLVSEAFIRFFLETIGHYSLFLTQNEKGERVFQREAFRKSVASKSIRRFLGVFMESQMFAGFIQDREMRKCRAKGLFEQRVEQYLEELPDTEQSGVNKFLKGLGSKMKFLHKKN